MTKTFKRIFVGVLTAIAFAVAGLFFAGCDEDYSNVSVTTDVSSLSLEVGQTETLTFEINNAPSSFYNNLNFNVDNEGKISIQNKRINGNSVSVDVTALEGGTVNLMAVTEDNYIYTFVQVTIIQHSETMEFNSSFLYYTYSSPFQANDGYFNFDANTTDRDVTFYFLTEDVSNHTFIGFENIDITDTDNFVMPEDPVLRFNDDETSNVNNVQAYKFQTASVGEVDGEKVIFLDGNLLTVGENEDYVPVSDFQFIAIYNHSVISYREGESPYLTSICDVKILNDLNVEVSGGYVDVNGEVDFQTLTSNDITLIPNSSGNVGDTYILRIVADTDSDLVNFSIIEGDYLSVDILRNENYGDTTDYTGKTVYYLEIVATAFGNFNSEFSLQLGYDGTEEVLDANVNYTGLFSVETQYVAREVYLNGVLSTAFSADADGERTVIYNAYTWPEFGWKPLNVEVSSGLDVEPIYDYAIIEFNEEHLRFRYGLADIESGRRIYDLSTGFTYKGVDNAPNATGSFTITLVNTAMQAIDSENASLVIEVYYQVLDGADRIDKSTAYGNPEENQKIYLDYQTHSRENANLTGYLIANSYFESFTVSYEGGDADVVDFVIGNSYAEEAYQTTAEGDYNLCFSLRAKAVGEATYRVTLDNGESTTFTVEVINSLRTNPFGIDIVSGSYIGYYDWATSSTEEVPVDYNDILNLEILNPTTTSGNAYVIQYNNITTIQFYGQIDTINRDTDVEIVAGGNVISVSPAGNNSFNIETLTNGVAQLVFSLNGDAVNDQFNRVDAQETNFTINITSYSLLSEFILTNGGSPAVDNVVYYGASDYIPEEDRQIDFDIQAENRNAYNFYRYYLNESFFFDDVKTENGSIVNDIINRLLDEVNNQTQIASFTYSDQSASESDLTMSLCQENFSEKFVYFYAGTSFSLSTRTLVQITVSDAYGNSRTDQVQLAFNNGFMFYSDGIVRNEYELNGELYEVSISFSNVYNIGNYGTFDLTTLLYEHESNFNFDLTIHAYVRQRNYTRMHYEATIHAVQYTPVESVVTATNVTELIFTNSTLEHNFVVYVSPNDATNTSLTYTFNAKNSISRNLISVSITQVQSGFGTYLIEVSAQNFYNNHPNIVDIEEQLAGTLYIYPVEWGDNPSVIDDNQPIVIDVSYRNGSENNRYILDTPEDVLAINANEVSLSSHYEIRNMIDMSSVSASVPIGLLANTAEDGTTTYTLQGFSGSIVGTTNEAEIANVSILSNIEQNTHGFGATVDQTSGAYYAGLFAQINEGGYLKNLTISGDMAVSASGTTYYIGLVAGVNNGTLTNVQANIYRSSINLTRPTTYYIGGVVGSNNGEITQYFPAYNVPDETVDNELHTVENYVGEFEGQTPKNIVNFQAELSISFGTSTDQAILYVGGIAGESTGTIEKVDDASLRLYGYTNYSAITNIGIETASGSMNVYAGGAVGRLISSGTQDVDGETYYSTKTRVENLLVGGILDSAVTTTVSHYVGGIVGFATLANATGSTYQNNSVYINNNTSRIFLRGEANTGAILGGDDYNNYRTIVRDPSLVNVSISNNVVEAVDDGKTALEASMIIIRSNSAKFGSTTLDTNEINRIISVGNVGVVNRNYSAITFAVSSYVRRNMYQINSDVAVNPNDTTTSNYYGDYLIIQNDNRLVQQYEFSKADVNLGLEENSSFKLSLVNTETGNVTEKNVFLMFYFDADCFLNAEINSVAQDAVDELNTFNPNSALYPFAINTRDAQIISTTTDILRVDINGNLTSSAVGTATIRLQSVLNTQTSVEVTLYIVNYFNKDVETSIFYSSNSSSGLNITNGSQVNVFGDRQTTLYAVPSYELDNYTTTNNNQVSISRDGVLRINNQDILLERNESLTVESTYIGESVSGLPEYTRYMINGQSVIYYGRVNNDVIEGVDNYSLSSYISARVDGQDYIMAIGLQDINIRVAFYETATAIQTKANLITIQSNDEFSDSLVIESRNNEFAYYEIIFTDENGNEEIIQSRLPSANGFGNDSEYYAFVNDFSSNDLFNLTLTRAGTSNTFDFTLAVNKTSSAYINRNIKNIYGSYRIVFYANELQDGVSCNFDFFLKEAEITNVSIENYSNFNDMAISDETIVPSQYGILEISIDPVDAEFDAFTISNNTMNYNDGVNEVMFTFVYQHTEANGVVEYVADTNFVAMNGGRLTFRYNDYINYLESHGETYNGRVYIQYFLGSQGVEDDMPITFDVDVSYNNGLHFTSSITLITHLANYVHLTFNDRVESESDTYFVARGLNYGMTLDYYGFSLEDIEITVSDEKVATISGNSRDYSLNITPNQIDYQNDIGYLITINVFASRIVDNVTITDSETLTVYIMEYVFNYENSPETDYDIVRGEEDGVITTAIGSAYALELDIWDYMEYDSTNASVVRNAQNFVDRLTNSVTFAITDSSVVGRVNVPITSDTTLRSDYYYINGRYFTGIRLYNAEQNIYNFSVSGSYYMHNGIYECGDAPIGTSFTGQINEEFAFTVTNQSSEESPIPIEDYDDLKNMQEGQHYILLNDIILPNADSGNQFEPINTQVASFDGNMHVISMAGDYRYDSTMTSFGLFGNIGQNTVIRNVIIELSSSTNIVMNSSSLSVGVIAASNAGNITNCEVRSLSGSVLTVSLSQSATDSYLTGFVASNSGIITNSRSSVDIYATVNISGFVGTNSGTISSSYFMGGSLRNGNNTTTQYTAGFALSNSGNIYTSYVSGEITASNDEVYYKGTDDYIASFNSIAGFVFQNSGNVEDCYSNINMEEAGLYSAGFVMINTSSGFIGTSISTSVLRNHNTNAYGFARNNLGTISSCYWLSDENEGTNGINAHISTIENNSTTSVNSLTKDEFSTSSSTFEENFKNFVYTQTRGYDAVWFYNNRNSSATFNGSIFNTSRLQLVAPNIIAFSQRELYSAEEVYDEESGVTYVEYVYVNTPASGVSGSVYNPILIQNAEQFENYILNGNNSANYNYSYYRMINNIDYSELDTNSSLYNTRFMGYLEGNFLTISNLHMVSSEALTYAGLFAEVGSSSRSGAIGVLLNFNLQVSEMVFSNAQVVGAVAGRLDAGVVANVNVSGATNTVVTGKNIVGGVVGLAVGDFNIENIETSMSATATYTVSSGNNVFDSRASTFTQYSFAGSLVGVASGEGEVNNISLSDGVAVIGAKAGGLIGLVDTDVEATNLTLNVDNNLLINAFNYGGLLIGESKGSVANVVVNGTDTYLSIFSTMPYTPTAVGGIAGLVSGGSMRDVSMSQSLNLSNSLQVDGVANIGGVAGMVTGNFELTNANVEAGFIGYQVVGGIIGLAQASNSSLIINNVNYVNGYLSVLSSQNSNAYAGGIIGFVNGLINVQINKELSTSLLGEIATHIEDMYQLADFEDLSFLEDEDIPDDEYQSKLEAIRGKQFSYAGDFVGTETYTSLSTDLFTNEDGTQLNENYLNEANRIEFDLVISTIVYNSSFNTYIGEVIGRAVSAVVQVYNTVSSMTANVSNYDMGIINPESHTDTMTVQRGTYSYNYYNYPRTFVDEENPSRIYDLIASTGYGFTDVNSSDGSITRAYDQGGYLKGAFAGDYVLSDDENKDVETVNYLIPLYSQNISYTYYIEGVEGATRAQHLQVTNYGVCVDSEFIG